MVVSLGAWYQAIDGFFLLLLDNIWLVGVVGCHHIPLVGLQIRLVVILLSELCIGGELLDLVPECVFGELVLNRLAPVDLIVHHIFFIFCDL